MKVLLSWLRECCPVDLSPDELAHRLTAQGVKVEGLTRPWERLSGVMAARVLDVKDHPNSDKLCLARVSVGTAEREVVVGVRNMKPGDLVPLAGPGASVPGLPEPLSPRTIRGVVSDGMLCSPRELGVGFEHTGILILPPETPIGADVRSEFGLDDVLFDIEVKSNRPDLLSVFGVAREAAAATGAPLVHPDIAVAEANEKAEELAGVEIRDLERCPRYLARVIRGVQVGPSPIRAQARLTASGIRPLTNVVDATNYALVELGHPLHAFDLSLLEGAGVVVRRAGQGERLVTLDEVERSLTSDDLVIADHAKSVAVAGVMGSASAEVSGSTRDVLLESAYFEPHGIRRTARRLGLSTEASTRFERGADPEAVDRAADRAARLMADWANGRVLAGSIQVGEAPPRRHLIVRPVRASLLLGHPVSAEDAEGALARLGFPGDRTGPDLDVEVPSYRPDLEREVDLIEEVARVQGYDRVGSMLPGIAQAGGLAATYSFRGRVRRTLVRTGLREGMSYSFASGADLELMGDRGAVRVANPLSADEAYLRTSLVPGLLRAVASNLARGNRGAALFETGRVFRSGGDAAPLDERDHVAAALSGTASHGYPEPPRQFGFLDAKGALEALMETLGIGRWSLGDRPGHPFHPARSATVVVGGRTVGAIGEVHPGVAERLDVPPETAVFELDLTALAPEATDRMSYREISRFPPVHRDLAFIVDERVPAGAIFDAIRGSGGELVETVTLFDVFQGDPVPAGKKSLAFSVDFRASDRTLTDEEVEALVAAIVRRVASEYGGELRSG